MTAYHMFTLCAWIQDTSSNINNLFKQLGLSAGSVVTLLYAEIFPPSHPPPSVTKWVPEAIWPTCWSEEAFLRGTPLCELKTPPAHMRTCIVTDVKDATMQNGSLSLWAWDDGQTGCIVFDSSCQNVRIHATSFHGARCRNHAANKTCSVSTM